MTDENVTPDDVPEGADVPELPSPEDMNSLAEALANAIKSIDLEEARAAAETHAEMTRRFPEHAKAAMVAREAGMLHVFLQHYLPTQGLMLARQDGTPFHEEEEEGGDLITKFFGLDPQRLRDEEPGLLAEAHRIESEYEADHPDPSLSVQMAEFEAMLADMEPDPSDETIPEEEYR